MSMIQAHKTYNDIINELKEVTFFITAMDTLDEVGILSLHNMNYSNHLKTR